MGWCASISCLSFSKITPFARVLTSPFQSLFGLVCAESFQHANATENVGCEKRCFFPQHADQDQHNTHQTNAQVSVVERVEAKGGQNHLAQPAVETQHQQMLD